MQLCLYQEYEFHHLVSSSFESPELELSELLVSSIVVTPTVTITVTVITIGLNPTKSIPEQISSTAQVPTCWQLCGVSKPRMSASSPLLCLSFIFFSHPALLCLSLTFASSSNNIMYIIFDNNNIMQYSIFSSTQTPCQLVSSSSCFGTILLALLPLSFQPDICPPTADCRPSLKHKEVLATSNPEYSKYCSLQLLLVEYVYESSN